MIGGIIKASLTAKENIYVSDINEASLNKMKESYGVNTTTDVELAKECDIIVRYVTRCSIPYHDGFMCILDATCFCKIH